MSASHGSPSTDEELGELETANVTDDEAFGAFYDRWCASAYGLALHILRDQERAEAVTEEAFCRTWRHTRRLDNDGQRAGLWLLRLTQSLAVEALRRARAQVSPSGLPPLVDAAAFTSRNAQTPSVRPARTTAVEMAFWDGLTCREIAAATGATVAQALNDLRVGLRGVQSGVAYSAQCLDGDQATPAHSARRA